MKQQLAIADLFCGAGGTTSGAKEAAEACGYNPTLTAINHWPRAIETHKANHPDARHLCTSVDDLNPRTLYVPFFDQPRDGRTRLDVLLASPECIMHSNARGGRPINEQSRATAHCVTRWAEALQPPIIIVENVPEFVNWGPVDRKGRPIKGRKGELFRAWIQMLAATGYRVEWKVLCAARAGDPTTRERLFVQAVRGRRRIVWPNPTHAPRGSVAGAIKPFVPAREIIDWTLRGESIFEKKKPLVAKTIRRILTGLERFALSAFLHDHPRAKGKGIRSCSKPLPMVTASSCDFALTQPAFVLPNEGFYRGNAPRSLDEPLATVTAEHGAGAVVGVGFIVEHRGTNDRQVAGSAKSLDEPISAVATSGAHHSLAETSFLVQVNHGNGRCGNRGDARRTRSVEEPLPTVCGTRGEWAKATSFLVPNFGERSTQGPRVHSVDEPAPCITSHGAGAIVSATLGQQSGAVARDVRDPLATVATTGGIGLVDYVISIDHQSVKTGSDRAIDEPLSTVTSKQRHSLIRPEFLVSYYSTGAATSVDEPTPTVTTRDRFSLARPTLKLVPIGGRTFRRVSYWAWKRLVLRQAAKKQKLTRLFLQDGDRVLVLEITHRMLQVPELAGAQGFRRNYVFTGTKTEQVKQIGNAVPRRLSRALVAAALTQEPDVSWILDSESEAA